MTQQQQQQQRLSPLLLLLLAAVVMRWQLLRCRCCRLLNGNGQRSS
jgi:hypothetical protein